MVYSSHAEATPQSPFSKHDTVAGFSFSLGFFLFVAFARFLARVKPKELPKSRTGTEFL
jgi:hypothetical protein